MSPYKYYNSVPELVVQVQVQVQCILATKRDQIKQYKSGLAQKLSLNPSTSPNKEIKQKLNQDQEQIASAPLPARRAVVENQAAGPGGSSQVSVVAVYVLCHCWLAYEC